MNGIDRKCKKQYPKSFRVHL